MDLVTLNDIDRKASLGTGYKYLKLLYPNWSRDLHLNGNNMEICELEFISKHGLIRWYFKLYCNYDIDYNYNNINRFINNPKLLTYYDFKCLIKLSKYHDINIINGDNNLNNIKIYNYKFEHFISKYKCTPGKCDNKIMNNFINKKFGTYLIYLFSEDKLIEYLNNVKNIINEKQYYFKFNSLYETFIERNKKILKMGCIYHRFKIILEKIVRYNHKDIYKIDKFVDLIQQYIYSIIIIYNENILINNNSDIVLKNEDKIIKDIYLNKHSDENIKMDDYFNFVN
jgi:hypothetical protein